MTGYTHGWVGGVVSMVCLKKTGTEPILRNQKGALTRPSCTSAQFAARPPHLPSLALVGLGSMSQQTMSCGACTGTLPSMHNSNHPTVLLVLSRVAPF